MNNPALPHGLDRGLPFRRLSTLRKRAEKKGPGFKLRNLLKSLDWDERIQGNPRESKAQNRVLSQRNGREPRKSKRIDRTDVAVPAEKEPNRLHPKAKRPTRLGSAAEGQAEL